MGCVITEQAEINDMLEMRMSKNYMSNPQISSTCAIKHNQMIEEINHQQAPFSIEKAQKQLEIKLEQKENISSQSIIAIENISEIQIQNDEEQSFENSTSKNIKFSQQMKLESFGRSQEGDLRSTQKIKYSSNSQKQKKYESSSSQNSSKKYIVGLSVIQELPSSIFIKDSGSVLEKKIYTQNNDDSGFISESVNTENNQMKFSHKLAYFAIPSVDIDYEKKNIQHQSQSWSILDHN